MTMTIDDHDVFLHVATIEQAFIPYYYPRKKVPVKVAIIMIEGHLIYLCSAAPIKIFPMSHNIPVN